MGCRAWAILKKMKTSILAALMVASVAFAGAEDVGFGDSIPDSPRPERQITAVPKSLAYTLADGFHVYTIKDIYAISSEREISDPGLSAKAFIPDCKDCSFDFERRTCTIRTTRRLTYSELAYAIDDIAKHGCDMPYWAELVARDVGECDESSDFDFVVEEFKGDFPKNVAWFSLSDDRSFEIPFGITPLHHLKVLIVPTNAHCMCHSRYCIRILDTNGRVAWKDTGTAYAAVSVAVCPTSDGFGHQLLVSRYDHGEKAKFAVKLKRELAGADKPASAMELERK